MENQITKAWGWLVALSAAVSVLTLASFEGPPRLFVGFLILVLAGWKARIILLHYLGLQRSAFWRRSFEIFLMVFLIAAFVVYAVPWGQING